MRLILVNFVDPPLQKPDPMKNLLKKVHLVALAVMMITSCEKQPEILPSDAIGLKDKAFFVELLKKGVDLNHDSQISYWEAEHVTELYLNNANISDLSGISAFVNLKTLSIHQMKLSELNLS